MKISLYQWGELMTFAMLGLVTLLVLAYLVYTMIHPEKF